MYRVIQPPEPVFTYGKYLSINYGSKLNEWFRENKAKRIELIQAELNVSKPFSLNKAELIIVESCIKENLSFQKLTEEEIALWIKYKNVRYSNNQLRLSDKCKSICFDLGVWVGEYFKTSLGTDWKIYTKKTVDFNSIVLPSASNNMVYNPLTFFEVIALKLSRNTRVNLMASIQNQLSILKQTLG